MSCFTNRISGGVLDHVTGKTALVRPGKGA
jgi:hypothetical protein